MIARFERRLSVVTLLATVFSLVGVACRRGGGSGESIYENENSKTPQELTAVRSGASSVSDEGPKSLVWKIEIKDELDLFEVLENAELEKEIGINVILSSPEGVVCDILIPDGLSYAKQQKVESGWIVRIARPSSSRRSHFRQ